MDYIDRDSYVKDCIHLKACRRMRLIAKSEGVNISMHCCEMCTALERIAVTDEEVVDLFEAVQWAWDNAKKIRDGLDEKVVYRPEDLNSHLAKRLIPGVNNCT